MASMRPFRIPVVLLTAAFLTAGAAADERLDNEAAQALRRAVEFFHHKVASHGGYVYRYSADLSKREGEGKADVDTVWVQPPGTPAVGMAYLDAYERLGEAYLLEAAKAAGECLVQGQLRSGGWNASIEFALEKRAKIAYRVDPPGKKRASNNTSFDDNKTQSAMRLLIRLDKALGFKDPRIHESIQFALESVLKAQFPNGGWAQTYSVFPDPSQFPVRQASYPQSWPRTYPGGDYWDFYTFNDNAMADTIEMLLLAAEVYREPRYRAAALRGGDFILLAQMPDPQPAWAQQYNFEMHPAWARKFEPPAISGGESQGLIQKLLDLYVETGDQKYLAPVPKALAYLRNSTLPDGRLARFYELQTNRPLYLTRNYELTYDDSDLPTHYGFKISSRIESLGKQYDKLAGLSSQELAQLRTSRMEPKRGKPSEKEVRAVIRELDERGAWVEAGTLRSHGKDDNTRKVIESATFIRNVGILSQYLARQKR